MRATGFATALLVLAMGCGGSGLSGRLEAACIKEGGMSEAQCKCVADRAEKDLSKDAQALVLAEMEDDRDRVDELSKRLTMQDAASVGAFLTNAIGQCTLGDRGE